MPASKEVRRKPRQGHKPYDRTPRPPKNKNPPKTSAITKLKDARSNLTLSDWLEVVHYYDDNQPLSQPEVVKYFASRSEGALLFSQSALSRHLARKGREEDQQRLLSNPSALSGKRARVVTRPDVEKALVLWVKHMEEKLEHVTSAMLVAKRGKFEDLMDVPEEERLRSDGWVQKFCRA
jgi:hypothetical protein